MKTLLVLTATLAALSPLIEGAPPLDRIPAKLSSGTPQLRDAYVTISYAELQALWEAGHAKKAIEKPEPPPVAVVINRSDCLIELGADVITIKANFQVETFETKWQSIFLIGGSDTHLEKTEATERAIVWDNGYRLLTNQPGKTQVTLHLSAPGLKTLNRPLKIDFGGATTKRVQIAGLPAGMEVRIAGKLGTKLPNGVVAFSLPSEAGPVEIAFAAPRVEKALQPSTWELQSQVLVRYAEGRLVFQTRLFAHTESGSGKELALVLPNSASAVTLTGEDVADWKLARADDGRRILSVQWKSADVLDRELVIAYAVPQSPLAEEWQLHAPGSVQEQPSRNLYVIIPAEGLEFRGDNLQPAIGAHRLPQWMREEIGAAPFVSQEAASTLVLRTHWLPVVPTAEAVISEAKSALRLVADGSMQTDSTFQVRHQAALAWRVELPPKVELLSCTVGGKPARPIQREPNVIELTLPAANGKPTGINLVYAAKNPPLDPVSGQIALELPKTALFIERLEWVIAFPAVFEITAIEGNVAVATEGSDKAPGGGDLIRLSKDLCKAERPVVALFYQRRAPQQ